MAKRQPSLFDLPKRRKSPRSHSVKGHKRAKPGKTRKTVKVSGFTRPRRRT